MESLPETQYRKLAQAIRSGHTFIEDVVVLGQFICEHKDDRLIRRVQCGSEYVAHKLLAALQREEGCSAC